MSWPDFVRAVRLHESAHYALASQESVALRAGIHPRRWSRLEAGSVPTVDEALLICDLVKVSVEEAGHLAELQVVDIAIKKGWTQLTWWCVPHDWRAGGQSWIERGLSLSVRDVAPSVTRRRW
jgi:transcriptional regulator with XRE-family HTH domain